MKLATTAAVVACMLATTPAHAGWDIAASINNAASRIESWAERNVTMMLDDFSRTAYKVRGRAWNESDYERRSRYNMRTVDANEIKGLITPDEADRLRAKIGRKLREDRKKAALWNAYNGPQGAPSRSNPNNCTNSSDC